jgi:hypothetical protein
MGEHGRIRPSGLMCPRRGGGLALCEPPSLSPPPPLPPATSGSMGRARDVGRRSRHSGLWLRCAGCAGPPLAAVTLANAAAAASSSASSPSTGGESGAEPQGGDVSAGPACAARPCSLCAAGLGDRVGDGPPPVYALVSADSGAAGRPMADEGRAAGRSMSGELGRRRPSAEEVREVRRPSDGSRDRGPPPWCPSVGMESLRTSTRWPAVLCCAPELAGGLGHVIGAAWES